MIVCLDGLGCLVGKDQQGQAGVRRGRRLDAGSEYPRQGCVWPTSGSPMRWPFRTVDVLWLAALLSLVALQWTRLFTVDAGQEDEPSKEVLYG